MDDQAPRNAQEYIDRFARNQKIEGFGLQVGVHVPCPFCAAPDFIVHKVIETENAMKNGAVCKECGRGAKAVFLIDTPEQKQFEIVQTSGPDAPDWLQPKMRRVGS